MSWPPLDLSLYTISIGFSIIQLPITWIFKCVMLTRLHMWADTSITNDAAQYETRATPSLFRFLALPPITTSHTSSTLSHFMIQAFSYHPRINNLFLFLLGRPLISYSSTQKQVGFSPYHPIPPNAPAGLRGRGESADWNEWWYIVKLSHIWHSPRCIRRIPHF